MSAKNNSKSLQIAKSQELIKIASTVLRDLNPSTKEEAELALVTNLNTFLSQGETNDLFFESTMEYLSSLLEVYSDEVALIFDTIEFLIGTPDLRSGDGETHFVYDLFTVGLRMPALKERSLENDQMFAIESFYKATGQLSKAASITFFPAFIPLDFYLNMSTCALYRLSRGLIEKNITYLSALKQELMAIPASNFVLVGIANEKIQLNSNVQLMNLSQMPLNNELDKATAMFDPDIGMVGAADITEVFEVETQACLETQKFFDNLLHVENTMVSGVLSEWDLSEIGLLEFNIIANLNEQLEVLEQSSEVGLEEMAIASDYEMDDTFQYIVKKIYAISTGIEIGQLFLEVEKRLFDDIDECLEFYLEYLEAAGMVALED